MAKKIEQTKGYLNLRGEIYGLTKEPQLIGGFKRILRLTIKTTEGKRVPVILGDRIESKLTVKYKCEGMDKALEVNEAEAIDLVQSCFTDGDSVFVKCRQDVNTYKDGSLDFYIGSIFISKDKIDFEASNFNEVNELTTTVIAVEKATKGVQKVAFANYKGETLIKELIINDDEIQGYFDTLEVGDLTKVVLNVTKEPIYDTTQQKPKDGEKTVRTLKKGTVAVGNQSNGKMIGVLDILEVTDVMLDDEEKAKYTKEDLNLVAEESDDSMPF